MRLMTKDLSEPYSIYTYRFFVHNWPELCILVRFTKFFLFISQFRPLTAYQKNVSVQSSENSSSSLMDAGKAM